MNDKYEIERKARAAAEDNGRSHDATADDCAPGRLDEDILRRMARDAIAAGRLPGLTPNRMWGGNGTGARCAVCGHAVTPDEVGFDLEFAGGNGNGHGSRAEHVVHVACFAAWELECTASAPLRPLSEGPVEGTIPVSERHRP